MSESQPLAISSLEALSALVAGDPEELKVHFELIERDIRVEGIDLNLHCHCMRVGADGRISPDDLAQFMRFSAADYAIPRSRITEAQERDRKFRTNSAMAALQAEAEANFTGLAKTGEPGELLLFLFAERFLKIPHLLSKMDLKTSSQMHYHGADGVYADVGEDGVLRLFWGEAKVYKSIGQAVQSCMESLGPFLSEDNKPDATRNRDLVLLRDKADLDDPQLTKAIMRYFDRTKIESKRVRHCGVALIGFDVNFYPSAGQPGLLNDVVAAAKSELKAWTKSVGAGVVNHKLQRFTIEFICIPLPSAEGFRAAFLKALGHGE